MSRIYSVLCFCLVALNICTAAQAQEEAQTQTTSVTTTTTPNGTVVEKRVIVTTTPAPKEVVTSPAGYVYCFSVKAGWYQDVWVAEHNVCTYPNSPNGTIWIDGYWACNKYDINDGTCTTWEWKPAHWEKTVTVY